jgi:hypothetical protein
MTTVTEEELQDTIFHLRSFAAEQGMQWVLDEVDDAIALGVPETRTLRQTSRRGQTTYEDVTPGDELFALGQGPSRRSRRSEEFIRSRPMTALEQVNLLLQALRTVLADLDVIATGTLEALDPATLSDYIDPDSKTGLNLVAPEVETISFVPDEGSIAPGISINFIRQSQRRTRVSEIIDQIEAAVES